MTSLSVIHSLPLPLTFISFSFADISLILKHILLSSRKLIAFVDSTSGTSQLPSTVQSVTHKQSKGIKRSSFFRIVIPHRVSLVREEFCARDFSSASQPVCPIVASFISVRSFRCLQLARKGDSEEAEDFGSKPQSIRLSRVREVLVAADADNALRCLGILFNPKTWEKNEKKCIT